FPPASLHPGPGPEAASSANHLGRTPEQDPTQRIAASPDPSTTTAAAPDTSPMPQASLPRSSTAEVARAHPDFRDHSSRDDRQRRTVAKTKSLRSESAARPRRTSRRAWSGEASESRFG